MEETFEKRLKETLEASPPVTPGRCTPATHTPSPLGGRLSGTAHSTPLSSARRRGAYYDRCIPSRVGSPRRCLFGSPRTPLLDHKKEQSAEPPKVENLTYQSALQNELLKRSITEIPDPHSVSRGSSLGVLSPSKSNILKYQSSPRKLDPLAPYSISPISKSRYTHTVHYTTLHSINSHALLYIKSKGRYAHTTNTTSRLYKNR
jgi:hypothetical protein